MSDGEPSGEAAVPDRGEAATMLSNSGSLVASRLIVAGLGWAGTVIIARGLSVEDWGQFSFIFGFLALVSTITDLRIGRVVLTGLVDEGTDRRQLIGTYILLRCALGVVGYAVSVGFVLVAGYPSEVIVGMAIAGLVLILASSSNAYHAAFQVTTQLRPIAVSNTLGQLAQLALTVAIASAGGTLVWFTVPAVVFEVVALAYKIVRLPADLRPRYAILRREWARLLREALPLAVGGVLATAFYRIDIVLLSQLDTFDAVGIYGIGYKFAGLVHAVSTAVTTAVLVHLVRAWPNDPEAFGRNFRWAFRVLTVVGGLIVVETIVFSGPAIDLLYGHRYADATDATRLVVTSEVLHFFTSLALTALIAAGKHREYPIASFLALVANVALNLWLIPAYSYNGAAWATIVTELLVLVMLGVPAVALAGVRPLPWATVVKCTGAAAAAAAVAVGLDTVGPWPVAAAASVAVFLGAVHVLRAPGPEGLRSLGREEAAASPGAVTPPR